MTRCLLAIVLGVSMALGLLRPLPLGEAAVIAKSLAQTPVTGRLADGGTFQGRLTLQALRFDEAGHLVATGVMSGVATPAVGRTTQVPAHTFTTPVALLDLRGTCKTLVVDLAPLIVAPLVQALTLVPVVLTPQAAPKEERRWQRALIRSRASMSNVTLAHRRPPRGTWPDAGSVVDERVCVRGWHASCLSKGPGV